MSVAQFGTPYWAVVSGSAVFPLLSGAERGVQADVPLDEPVRGARVWSSFADAERDLRARALVNASLLAAGREYALQPWEFAHRYRVQQVVRPAGALPTVWFPADEPAEPMPWRPGSAPIIAAGLADDEPAEPFPYAAHPERGTA